MTTQVLHQDLTIGCTVEVTSQDKMEPVQGYLLTAQVEGVDVIYYVEIDGIVQGYRASELTPVDSTRDDGTDPTLYEAVVASANLKEKVDRIKSRLAMRRYEMVQKIKEYDDLCQLQESIDMLDAQAKNLEKHLEDVKAQVRVKAVASWQPGSPKKLLGGVLTVKEMSNKELHWDEQAAMEFALSQPLEFVKALLKPNKTAFKTFMDVLAVPVEAYELGTTYTAEFNYDKLIEFVSFDMLEDEETSIADSKDKNVLESVKNGQQATDYSDVPF